MDRRRGLPVAAWVLMAAFFAGVNRFDGDRWAQAGVALAYVAMMVVVMRRASRRAA